MGRLFSMLLLSAAMLVPAAQQPGRVQPAFFSMLFPQLVPGAMEATAGEAVFL